MTSWEDTLAPHTKRTRSLFPYEAFDNYITHRSTTIEGTDQELVAHKCLNDFDIEAYLHHLV